MWTAVARLLELVQYGVDGRDPIYLVECGLVFVFVGAIILWLALEATYRGGKHG